MSFDDDDHHHHDNKREKIMINTIEKKIILPSKIYSQSYLCHCVCMWTRSTERENDMTVCTDIIKWMNYNELYDFLYIFFILPFSSEIENFFFSLMQTVTAIKWGLSKGTLFCSVGRHMNMKKDRNAVSYMFIMWMLYWITFRFFIYSMNALNLYRITCYSIINKCEMEMDVFCFKFFLIKK